jgi:inosine-uridine nucleoside N-ribohydrolase
VPYRRFPQLDVGKVIIDTDAGADDAAAIIMALNQEKYNSSFKVVAITCVNGNTALDNVVVNVFKTLQTANRLDVSPSTLLINRTILTQLIIVHNVWFLIVDYRRNL